MSNIYTIVKMPLKVFKGRYIQFMVERGDIEFIRHYRDLYGTFSKNKEWLEFNKKIKELKEQREELEFNILNKNESK